MKEDKKDLLLDKEKVEIDIRVRDSSIAQFDEESARIFLNELFNKASEGYITIGHKHPEDKSKFFPTTSFHIKEINKLLDFCKRNINKNLWFSVGVLDHKPAEGSRGGKKDVKYIPGVWFDLDCAEGYPEENRVGKPTLQEAHSFISELPLEPSIIVSTAGGYHGYWLFEELLEVNEDEELPKLFVDTINDFTTSKFELKYSDHVGDISRVMRLPGSFNYKWGKRRNVTIKKHTNKRYSVDDIREMIQKIKDETPKKDVPNFGEVSTSINTTTLSDEEVWDKLFKSPSGDRIHAMFEGDIQSEHIGEHARGDASSVDFALSVEIAKVVGDDPGRIERLLRQTKLIREKWDTHASYLQERTIAKAIKQAQKEAAKNKTRDDRPTQSQLLYEIAKNETYFHTPDGETYARIHVNNHYENWRVNSEWFRKWLRMNFHKRYGKTPGNQAVQDTINQLMAYAEFNQTIKEDVYIRLAGNFEEIYVDLGDPDWNTVKITKDGWGITQDPKLKFKRAKGMLPLPKPERGGSINELRKFVNVSNEEWPLSIAYLVGCFHPSGPYPILVIQGEQGSAKSTHTRIFKSLIDPSVADIRSLPKDEKGIAIAGNSSWCLAFDNLSGISYELADAVCKLSTGAALTDRKLYTDDEEQIFSLKRPVILNGIDDIATRGDLGSRSVVINLPSISEEERKEESLLWKDFEEAQPRILGALFDVISAALRNHSGVSLKRAPRMIDFAKWVVAAEKECGLAPGAFMKVYDHNRRETAEGSITNDLVAMGITNLLSNRSSWRGNSSVLLSDLKDVLPYGSKLPALNKLKSRVERAKPVLKQTGIEITQDSRRIYTLRKVEIQEELYEEIAATSEVMFPEGWEVQGENYIKRLDDYVIAAVSLMDDTNDEYQAGVAYYEKGLKQEDIPTRTIMIAEGISFDEARAKIEKNIDALLKIKEINLLLD